MRTIIVEAKYIGEGYDSEFVNGNVYNLQVTQLFFGRIMVVPTHGYEYKPFNGIKEVYNSLAEFLYNWSISKPLQLNYWSGDTKALS